MDTSTKEHAVDQKALRGYRLVRVREQLRERDYAAAVLFDPINIRYATGTSNMQVWILHNAARYVFVPAYGPVVLFDFHNCGHLSDGIETVDEVRRTCTWFYFAAGPEFENRVRKWAAEIADLVTNHGGGNKRVAFDHLDPAGADALAAHGITPHNGQQVMEHARVIKSADEIAAMKVALGACEEGMRQMQAALRPGVSENELWSILHQVNIAMGGEWIETRLLSSGPHTNPWFQECGERIIEGGDLVSFDTDLIGPHGYCADVSRTWLCGDGKPTDEQRRLYALAREQIEYNTALMRPGASFREIAEKGFQLGPEYLPNRYSVIMHGVGLCDEYPHAVYREDIARSHYDGVLEENMTVCVESYIGKVGGHDGVKLEEQVLVTRDGPVLLSSYPLEDSFL